MSGKNWSLNWRNSINRADASFERALAHDRAGEDAQAQAAYLECLREDAHHVRALTHLGNLAFRTGRRSAALTAYRQAARCAPSDPLVLVNLGNALLDAAELLEAREAYEGALWADPAFAHAHQGLSYVLDRLGEDDAAQRHRDRGFSANPFTHIPYRGGGKPVRALVLVSAAGGNFNTEWLLNPQRYDVVRLAAEYATADAPLPPHDVLINAIGDAERCGPALNAALALAARSEVKVINDPALVLQTTRQANADRFRALPQVVAPRTVPVAREELARGQTHVRGLPFPLLLRTPGHHTGRHFAKIDTPALLDAAMQLLPGDPLLAIEYLDTRSRDGFTRKYRMMIVNGDLLALHAAVSPDWKVHYFSAAMSDPSHRAEDERFIRSPWDVLPAGARPALSAIARILGLDYGGIDFGVDASGRVVLFEANATMSVVPPDPGEQWAYRRPAVQRVFDAFTQMIAP